MINFLHMVLVTGRTVAMVGTAFRAMAAVLEVVVATDADSWITFAAFYR